MVFVEGLRIFIIAYYDAFYFLDERRHFGKLSHVMYRGPVPLRIANL